MFLVLVPSRYTWVLHRMRFLWSDRSKVAMSRSNAICCMLSFSATVLPCFASLRAHHIFDATSQIDLIARRASKKEDDFLVGHDLPHISRVRRILIFPWSKFSIPIVIWSLRPASYLEAIGSGGMDPIVIRRRMSW
jgi:hypothetical protein